MLATFTRLIADMVPGGGIHFGGVDRSDWRIYVNTRDGAVPLDSVSQGMSAILNWIGVLLQRLYDTYPGSAAPEQEAAIVLIDEIDAHLHPKWQRQIVTLARHHFKNVQMIASSHSPLLAGAVERFELRVVARDSETGDMRAAPPPEDLAGQKAEDILVSSMFALPTTRSVDAERTINRYFELYQKLAPSPAEEAELEELRGKVEALNYGPSGPEKQQLAELDSKLTADLDRISTDTLHALERLRTPERQSEKPS
jgi:predicted ATP-binding protein involved in virulence